MEPSRESFKSIDGRTYPLWEDINDVMSAIMPVYWSQSRDARRDRGWMFRGHADSDWNLTPTLHRSPLGKGILKRRQDYTNSFTDALRRQAGSQLSSGELKEIDSLAIAQHYGFYTELLDFSWNAEVAAYFATLGSKPGKVGVIYAFNLKEYKSLRNPFSALGISQDESDALLIEKGMLEMMPLPDLAVVDLHNIPRIAEQEGTFIRVEPDRITSLTRECIDRFYFRQRDGILYTGNLAHSVHLLPDSDMFDSPDTYQNFLNLARQSRPDLFARTPTFDKGTLFPPVDPVSRFADNWRRANPDPTVIRD